MMNYFVNWDINLGVIDGSSLYCGTVLKYLLFLSALLKKEYFWVA